MDYNVIGVDWRGMHGPWKTTFQIIGNYTAHFLQGMSKDYGLQIVDVHCIGFSYGTHVIGKINTTLIRYLIEIANSLRHSKNNTQY